MILALSLPLLLMLAAGCHGNESSKRWLETMPWTSRDVLLSVHSDLDVKSLTGPPLPIYRPDLGEEIAYWLIRYNDDNYAILSAGDHTGDYRVILQGGTPSPVDDLDLQAASVNSTCMRYTLLTPSPDLNMACDLAGRRITQRPVGDVNVTALWEAIRENPDEDDEDDDEDDGTGEDETPIHEDHIPVSDRTIDYYVISPAQPGVFPLSGMRNTRIRSLGTRTGSEVSVRVLCRLLGVCDEEGRVHVHRKTDYGEDYVQLEVAERDGADSWPHDLHFVLQATDRDHNTVQKGFVVEVKQRVRRETTAYTYYSIDQEHLMPDYNQFKYGKCEVGCGPVAWAQVFGYYDRRGHAGTGSSSSTALYRCGTDGTTGSNSCQAPAALDSRTRGYIGKLNDILGTFCLAGQGATLQRRMDNVEGFYRERQGSSGDVRLHTRWFFLTRLIGVNSRKVRDAALSYLRQKWPVIVGFRVSGVFSQHYAVMTRYRTREVKRRKCFFCRKKWHREYDMYLHMGWGGSQNGWRSAKMFMSVVAKY